jgi:uncharacterized protein involved in exopolysaccharide biosynthesis
MEDEIDLAQYIKTIFKHWKLVLGITLAAVVTAGVISFVTPPVYEAKALMQSSEASPKRMSDLAKSSETVNFMLRELTDNLTPAENNVASIVQMFKIDGADTFISCTVRNIDGKRAALLANAWASAFSKYATEVSINLLPRESELQEQIESNYAAYQDAQGSYDSFQLTSQTEKISKQISDARLLYQALQLQESLKNNQGSSVSGDAGSMAFLLLKVQSYTSLPQGTQLPTGAVAAVSKADIDNLVGELETRSGIHGKSAGEVFDETNTLLSRLDQESLRGTELLRSRDNAWNSYLAATKNAQEVNIKRSAMPAPVRLVSDATPPQDPVPSNRLMNMVIALVLGLIVGVIAAFVAEYFERKRTAGPAVGEAKQS